MQIIKREENHKNPVNTAKRNCYALGGFNLFMGVIFIGSRIQVAAILIVMGLFLITTGYFLSKNKKMGIYLSWVYVFFGIIVSTYNAAYLALIIIAYFAYWTHKAQKFLNSNTSIQS